MTVVIPAAQDGARDELPNCLWLGPSHWLAWYALLNTLVGSRVVEVPPMLSHHSVWVPLAQDQEVVQTLPSHTAQKLFTDRICLRAPYGVFSTSIPVPGATLASNPASFPADFRKDVLFGQHRGVRHAQTAFEAVSFFDEVAAVLPEPPQDGRLVAESREWLE